MDAVIKERDKLKKELDALAELNWQLYDMPGAVQDIKAQAELEAKMWEKESRITQINHYIYVESLRVKGSQ